MRANAFTKAFLQFSRHWKVECEDTVLVLTELLHAIRRVSPHQKLAQPWRREGMCLEIR